MNIILVILLILLCPIVKSLVLLSPLLSDTQIIAPTHIVFMSIIIFLLSLNIVLIFVPPTKKIKNLEKILFYTLILFQLSFFALYIRIIHAIGVENVWVNITYILIAILIIFELYTPKKYQWILDDYFQEFNTITLVLLTFLVIAVMYLNWPLSHEIISNSISTFW